MTQDIEKTSNIDIVIIWVDGSDPKWLADKMKYSGAKNSKKAIDAEIHRYRDWDNLQYLFRGIETFMPWVRKIHFVTAGHTPNWLNFKSEKLNFVRHEDYIPKEFLPTFSSHPIELNLHRIPDLAEKFIYFNDDMFITRPMQESDFFVNNMPCDIASFNPLVSSNPAHTFPHILLNNAGVINKHFNKNRVIKKHFTKIFSLQYDAITLGKNLLQIPFKKFFGFSSYHMPAAFLKSTFNEVWNKEPELLKATSSHKFRDPLDINQYTMKLWQIASGNFVPHNIKGMSKYFSSYPKQQKDLENAIKSQKYSMICINDTESCENFEEVKKVVIDSFETILPEKSSFEL